jgi:hypothetical protein
VGGSGESYFAKVMTNAKPILQVLVSFIEGICEEMDIDIETTKLNVEAMKEGEHVRTLGTMTLAEALEKAKALIEELS